MIKPYYPLRLFKQTLAVVCRQPRSSGVDLPALVREAEAEGADAIGAIANLTLGDNRYWRWLRRNWECSVEGEEG